MNIALEDLLLSPSEMAEVDRTAALSGIDSFGLMQQAGYAVTAAALRLYPSTDRFVILCGPGNNGGDGYVVAHLLAENGARIAMFQSHPLAALKGDAARATGLFSGSVWPIERYMPADGDVVIDAIFGAGLSRPVPGNVADAIARIGEAGTPVIAIDLPSGLDGLTGQVQGAAFRAAHTITFMTRKPGHLLIPGREFCGQLEVADIGIPARIVRAVASGAIAENTPAQWRHRLPAEAIETHKYRRGHLVVFSGEASKTGAARMAAIAGLKAGAGLVTIAAPGAAIPESAAHLTAIMIRRIDDAAALEDWLRDERLQTFVLGPGFGAGQKARDFVELLGKRHLVLDADGITAFKDDRQALFDMFAVNGTRLVMTPHEGEFTRLFPDLGTGIGAGKVERALTAARRSNAVIVYKGADTVIAAPDGRALINTNAPPWLATAGSGDVLAGIIGGMLAQGVPTFEAAAAGVYMHGAAAHRAGRGMTAEDLALHVAPLAECTGEV